MVDSYCGAHGSRKLELNLGGVGSSVVVLRSREVGNLIQHLHTKWVCSLFIFLWWKGGWQCGDVISSCVIVWAEDEWKVFVSRPLVMISTTNSPHLAYYWPSSTIHVIPIWPCIWSRISKWRWEVPHSCEDEDVNITSVRRGIETLLRTLTWFTPSKSSLFLAWGSMILFISN